MTWIGAVICLAAAVLFALASRTYFKAAAAHRAALENYTESVEWLRNVQARFPGGETSVSSEESK